MSNTIGFTIFLVPICCVVGWAIFRMLRDSRDAKLMQRSIDWPQTQGTVITNVQVRSHVEVEYEYSVSSRRYLGLYVIPLYKQSRFNSPAESSNEVAECLGTFPPDSNILVGYNPKKPGESVLYCRGGLSNLYLAEEERTPEDSGGSRS
jgi:Protein of unknown function (DUF3592)